MKKAIYVTPVIEIHRIEPPVIMAGSGEQNNISIDIVENPEGLLYEDIFRSKQNKKGLWDEDE